MVRTVWLALGLYFAYVAALVGVNALVAVHAPRVAPVSASIATVALALPLVTLKRHGFLSP